jgi:hypothetical protein
MASENIRHGGQSCRFANFGKISKTERTDTIDGAPTRHLGAMALLFPHESPMGG